MGEMTVREVILKFPYQGLRGEFFRGGVCVFNKLLQILNEEGDAKQAFQQHENHDEGLLVEKSVHLPTSDYLEQESYIWRNSDMKKLEIVITLMLTVGLITSCSDDYDWGSLNGGGGGGVDPGTVITQDNIEDISHLVFDLSYLGGGALIAVDDFFDTTTHECVDGGTVTTSGSISDPLAVDDTITLTFTSCNENGEITNGGMTMTISAVTPIFDWTAPFTLRIDTEFTNLSVTDTDLDLTSAINGDISILLSETLEGDITIEISGISLMTEAEGTVETLWDYQFVIANNYNSNEFSFDLKGTIESTLIGGFVSFDSTTAFEGDYDISDNPTSGVLLITSIDDNSKARLTAQADGVDVLIEVDANGDDIYETSYMRLWSELVP
jgi:hypothetical protein